LRRHTTQPDRAPVEQRIDPERRLKRVFEKNRQRRKQDKHGHNTACQQRSMRSLRLRQRQAECGQQCQQGRVGAHLIPAHREKRRESRRGPRDKNGDANAADREQASRLTPTEPLKQPGIEATGGKDWMGLRQLLHIQRIVHFLR